MLDLGAALRDQLLSRSTLWGPVRRLLQARLARALEAGQLARASGLLVDWLDTWPVGAAVDPAVSAWRAHPDAQDLAVLGRASELVTRGLGWGTVPGTPWPLPPADWLREQVEGSDGRLIGRGEGDQSPYVADALGLAQPSELRAPALPPVEHVAGHVLVADRARLAAAVVRGALGAVALSSPLPPGSAAQLALGELRMEGRHQRAYERYGVAGLRVSGLVEWSETLSAAVSGEAGPVLQATADALLAPGTSASIARGELETVGWLVWEAPIRPVAVRPVAVHVLRALDGVRDTAAVAAEVGGPADQVQQVLDELVEVGAATAA